MKNVPIKKNFSCEIDLHLIPRVFQAKKTVHCVTIRRASLPERKRTNFKIIFSQVRNKPYS